MPRNLGVKLCKPAAVFDPEGRAFQFPQERPGIAIKDSTDELKGSLPLFPGTESSFLALSSSRCSRLSTTRTEVCSADKRAEETFTGTSQVAKAADDERGRCATDLDARHPQEPRITEQLCDARRPREAERHGPKERVSAPSPRVAVLLAEHRLQAFAIEHLPDVIAGHIEADLADE